MRLEGWNLDQAIDRAFDDRSYDAGRPVIHAMLSHDPWTLYDPLYSEFVFTHEHAVVVEKQAGRLHGR